MAPLGVTDREELGAYALDAVFGRTLGAMRGATSGAMRGCEFVELEPCVVPTEKVCSGGILDAVKTVLLLRLASLTGEEDLAEFPVAPGGEAE